MIRLFNSVAFRLALWYGILVIATVAVISSILYLGTVGVISREINARLSGELDRLSKRFQERGVAGVEQGIEELLTDGIDTDTEVFLLVGPDGKKIVGNIDPENGSSMALKKIVTDVVEFYDAAAEEKGIRLTIGIEGEPTTLGDRDLLASATANVVDNALKYAGRDATVHVQAVQDRSTVSIVVQDNGSGIPAEEREKVMKRFYRGDRSRSLPGNGLGLPIVSSISHLHARSFALEDASPGLRALIVLPRVRA
jgi:signal transduction histidine kinase